MRLINRLLYRKKQASACFFYAQLVFILTSEPSSSSKNVSIVTKFVTQKSSMYKYLTLFV